MVNIRLATFLYPPHLDKDEKGEPTGIKLFLRRIHLVRSMLEQRGANTTVVYSDGLNLGKYENGTYDGHVGLIYNDEADITMMPCPLEIDPPPGKFGPVMYSASVHIYTMVNPSTWRSVDFLSCLNVFDKAINSLIILSLIAIGFLLVKHYKRQTLFVLLSNALEQSFSTVHALEFLPHLSMLMGILLVQALHSGLYSTNSWIETPPKQVDTLHDLVTQGKEPIFFKGSPVYLIFKNGFSKDAKKVWKKAQRVSLTKCVLDFDQLIEMASKGKFAPEKAFVFLEYFDALAAPIFCQFYGKTVVNKGSRLHASKAIHSGLVAALRNPRLSYSNVQLLDQVFYNLFEFGFVHDMREDFKRNPPMGPVMAGSPKCRREIFQAKALNENESEIKLTLVDVGLAFTLFFVTLILLSLLFMIGFLRKY